MTRNNIKMTFSSFRYSHVSIRTAKKSVGEHFKSQIGIDRPKKSKNKNESRLK